MLRSIDSDFFLTLEKLENVERIATVKSKISPTKIEQRHAIIA